KIAANIRKYSRLITGASIKKMAKTDELYNLARRTGMVSVRAAREYGIAPIHFSRLVQRGKLARVSRGLYELVEGSDVTEHHSLVEACMLVPKGIVCLLSALRLHRLTTQLRLPVWMALAHR